MVIIKTNPVVYIFFDHHLDLNAGKIPYAEGYKEDFVTILTPEELMVFWQNNPRPNQCTFRVMSSYEIFEIISPIKINSC